MKFSDKLKGFSGVAKKLGTDELFSVRKIVYFAFAILSLISVFLTFFAPLCVIIENGVEYKVTAAAAFGSVHNDEGADFLQTVAFVLILIVSLLNLKFIISALFSLKNEEKLSKNVRCAIVIDSVFVALFALFSALISPINVMLGGLTKADVSSAPLILIIAVCVLYSIFVGIVQLSSADAKDKKALGEKRLEERKTLRRKLRYVRIEMLAYCLVSAVLGAVSLLSNIITVTFDSKYASIDEISITGIKLLQEVGKVEDMGRQLLAFMIFSLLVILGACFILSLVSFFSNSKLFGKISLVTILASSAVTLAVGLFGKYYEMVQDLNEGIIISIIKDYIHASNNVIDWTVTSVSLYYFIASVVIVSLVFIRQPYTKALAIEQKIEKEDTSFAQSSTGIFGRESVSESAGFTPEASDVSSSYLPENFDPCPAFTSIDRKRGEYQELLEEKRKSLFADPSLPKLVDFIVQYARDSRLHLFYTQENIATFLAGLGTTKLTILQGMSGTGKTSLPKIVAEALMSVCDIVEVESSWRDKNELLGYYNEFSRTYTPKKFTQSLYRAKLNPDVLTFIVLDEMNLSRIEYYFSDFLSIMENEPDRREIKLLNVPLYRRDLEREYEYAGLTDGFTLKIPNNVWFIGTANRDESTYDISDKVYDRAHTMNFDKRAVSARNFGEPKDAKYLPVSALQNMFDEAKSRVDFCLDNYPVIAEVEKLLEPYNISFGNRIASQIESFVKIYASCFAVNEIVIRDALEVILLSKVVRKLELKSLDDQESLADNFAKLKLMRCSEFIRNIKES